MLKQRLNPININSITEFGKVRGSKNGDIKNTYMVKFVGADENTNREINLLREYLTNEMKQGRIYYKYIDSLEIKGDLKDIQADYEAFINTGHINIGGINLGDEGAAAIKEMTNILYKYKKNISETIQKNIMIKILYWLKANFFDIKINEGRNIKIVAENIQKESEIYFFVFLNLLGMDICLLQYAKDISVMEDYYYTKRLGDFFEGKMIFETPKPIETQALADERKNVVTVSEVTENTQKKVTISLASTRRKDRDAKRMPVVSVVDNSKIQDKQTAASSKSHTIPNPSKIKRDRELSYVELARLSTSIVMIAIYDNRRKRLGTGSGIMIGKDGFILTNSHVIRGGYYFEVRIEDDERIYETDEIIKYNQHLDLAIIRIARVLNPLGLYNGSESLVRGQKVVAIGSPLGLFNSVSDGIISGFRNIDNVDMIQFSAPTSPGSSGGAVLNMYGEVIGISTAGFSEGQNINLAVPYDAIYDFVKSFIR